MTSERKTTGALSAPPPPAGDVMSALIRAYENKIADLERELEKEREAAAFAQDQLDVALKDRDHAERQLEEVHGQLGAEHAAHLATGKWLADMEAKVEEKAAEINRLQQSVYRYGNAPTKNPPA